MGRAFMWPQLFGALACALALMLACGQPPGRGAGEVATTGDGATSFRVETVVANLEVPWSIAFTPDGRMLFTERPGRVRVFEGGRLRPEPLAVIPDVEPIRELVQHVVRPGLVKAGRQTSRFVNDEHVLVLIKHFNRRGTRLRAPAGVRRFFLTLVATLLPQFVNFFPF